MEALISNNVMKRIFYIFVALAGLYSCKGSEEDVQPKIANELTIHGLSDEYWTYFSFENGEVVGTGRFDNDEDDASWAERMDWDFAICGKYLKTNGGASGKGSAGVQKNNTDNFTTLSTAPVDGYLTDEIQIIR